MPRHLSDQHHSEPFKLLLLEPLTRLKQELGSLAPGTEIRVHLDAFKSLVKSLSDLSLSQHAVEPETGRNLALTHYTSIETMYSLISGGEASKLRLNDTVHVNDPREGITTAVGKKISDFLKITEKTHNIDERSQRNAKRYRNAYVLSFVSQVITDDQQDPPGDDLDFWRWYGRDGRGCSITLYPYLSNWPPELIQNLRQISYKPVEIQDEFEVMQLIFDTYMELMRLSENEETMLVELLAMRASIDECFRRRFLNKTSAYQSENEIRVVEFEDNADDIHYDVVNGEVRHHLEKDILQLHKLSYSNSEICVGPAVQHLNDVVDSFKNIWSKHWRQTGVPKVRINASKIDYRPSTRP